MSAIRVTSQNIDRRTPRLPWFIPEPPLPRALLATGEIVNSSLLIDKSLNASPDRHHDGVEVVLVSDQRRSHTQCRIGVGKTVRANASAGHHLQQCAMFEDREAQVSPKGRGRFRQL